MKRLIFPLSLLIVIIFTNCASSKIIVTYVEPIVKIYEANGTQADLFIKANRWMISTFKDARSIIQFSDKEEGIMIGKYLLWDDSISIQSIYAIIEISVKDNKARITISPQDQWYYTESKNINWNWQTNPGGISPDAYTKEMADKDIEELCNSFNQSLQAKIIEF